MSGRLTLDSSRIWRAARRGIPLAVIWLVLAGAGGEALVVGAIMVPLATWLSLCLLPGSVPLRFGPLLALFPRFVWQSLIGGMDVARRAFHPRLPIRPGRLRIAVDLPEGGRVALGGELSLMPGTLAAGCDGDRLLVHVLDLDHDIESVVQEEERRVRGTLDRAKTSEAGT